MAKSIVTIEDTEDGYSVSVNFEPSLEKGGVPTPAQIAGYELVRAIGQAAAPEAFDVLDESLNMPKDSEQS